MEELASMYETLFGPPDSLIELKAEEGIDFQIAVSLPNEELETEYTRVASLGLSQLPDSESHDIELFLETTGETKKEEVEQIGAFFYKVFDTLKDGGNFVPGSIYRTGKVPGFEGMDAVIALNYGFRTVQWLNEEDNKGLLVRLFPLYSEEADELEKIPVDSRELFIYRSGVAFTDPKRKKAAIIYLAVHNVWEKISEWYTENKVMHADKLAALLAAEKTTVPGEELEKDLGITLPEDFKQSFNIVNDGIRVSRYFLYKKEDILHVSERMNKRNAATEFEEAEGKILEEPEVEPVWWHEKWIPVAADSHGDMILLDMAPRREGKAGQVIRHSSIEGPAVSGHQCFLEWLKDYDADLRSGQYEVDEDGVLTES
jgi:cell wall assembly regulator SMI1